MPGKTSQSNRKQDSSKERVSSSQTQLSEAAGRKIPIWPEWTEAELAAEKWEVGGGKGKDKGKPSQVTAAQYDDPDGVLLPSSLVAGETVVWKRPTDPDIARTEAYTIVEDPNCTEIDLVSANAHILHSELMSSIVSQLQALWVIRASLPPCSPPHHNQQQQEEGREEEEWRPWKLVHPHTKPGSQHQLNSMGKYCVKLFWMGLWRKITVDDQLPFAERQEGDAEKKVYCPLLPRSSNPAELWPAILTKAILKVASLDYSGGSELSEVGECDITHMLTGWVPEVFPIRREPEGVWRMLRDTLPIWTREEGGASPEQTHRDAVILANFASHPGSKPLLPSLAKEIATSEQLLQQHSLLPHGYSLLQRPSFPLLLTRLREELLEPPPTHPPPPKLQQPYYLGLKHRRPLPGAAPPSPTPEPTPPRFLEIAAAAAGIATTGKRSEGPPGGAQTDGTEAVVASSSSQAAKKGEGEVSSESVAIADPSHVWMDYVSFSKAFSSVCVFRKPSSFAHYKTYCNLSKTVENTAVTVPPLKKSASSAQIAAAAPPKPVQLKDNNILFVDSESPVELQLVFSSLSNWREGHRDLKTKLMPSLKLLPVPLPLSSAVEEQQRSSHEEEGGEGEGGRCVVAGSLVLQPYTWRSLQGQEPALRVTTSGVAGARLSLPEGRNVFKLHAATPLGHHVGLFSSSEFELCDEDSIFTHLSKESARYVSFCSSTVAQLLSAAKHFRDEQKLRENVAPLVQLCRDHNLTADNIKTMLECILYTLSSHCEEYSLTAAMQFAWKAFLCRAFHHLASTSPQPPHSDQQQATLSVAALQRRIPGQVKPGSGGRAPPEAWSDRTPTAEEERAATLIQQGLRKHLRQRLHSATTSTASEEHSRAVEQLSASLATVHTHAEDIGLAAFNCLFKVEPELLERFPFSKDQLSRAFQSTFSGSVPPLQANSWTLLFREVFTFSEAQLLVPHFSCPVSTCRLRVIDNDSGSEMQRIFHCIAPQTYQPNKLGYTFMAEVWCGSGEGVEGGRWSVRLVSSSPRLPQRVSGSEGEEITTSFVAQELQDYALPDREGKLFRYMLTPTEECSISVQLITSKHDVYSKLEVLENECPVVATEGRGCTVLPLCTLSPPMAEADFATEGAPRKFILQATVIRDSWKVPDSAWPYISMIRSVDKLEDVKSASDVKPSSAKKGGRSKDRGAASRKGNNPQQGTQLDASKPHWTLRIVTKSSEKEGLQVRKDTQRADELRAMLRAWETEQPGRQKKAQQSRQKFLDTHAIREPSAPDEDQSVALSVQSEASSSLPRAPTGPVLLKPLDLSPFIVSDDGAPRLLDEGEQALRLQERQVLFKQYKASRQATLQQRNTDREERNQSKIQQLEQAEQWQVELDELRNRLNTSREAVRSKQLAKERARAEAEQAAMKAATHQEEGIAGRESKTKGKTAKGKK